MRISAPFIVYKLVTLVMKLFSLGINRHRSKLELKVGRDYCHSKVKA